MNLVSTDAAGLPPDRMQCMEVRGGNCQTNQALRTSGLDVWIRSQPLDEGHGGGDVYYLSSCASGRITRLLLADVCGHGSAVSELAISLRDLMRRNVNIIHNTRFVQEMNRQFEGFSQQGGFATALVSSFFAPTKSLTLCNAGHPTPFLYRCRTREWSMLEQRTPDDGAITDTPLGVTELAEYSQVKLKLDPGDLVLCFSDALPESCREDGSMLGIEGVLEILQALDVSRPGQLVSELLARIQNLRGGNLQEDDVSVLLFQANGERTTVKNNLLAPFRLLGQTRDKTQLSS